MHRIFRLAFVLVLFAALGSAHAAVSASVELGLGAYSRTESTACPGCVAQVSASLNTPPIAFSNSGTASASADFGTLKAYGRIEAFGEHSGSVIDVVKAKASFQDGFVVNHAVLNGTAGTVDISLPFSWSIIGASSYPPGTAFTATNQLTYRFFGPSGAQTLALFLREDLASSSGVFQSANTQGAMGSPFVGMPFGFMPTISLNFVFGQPIKVVSTLEIVMAVNDYNNSGITSLFGIDDAGNSAYWGGFAAVRDASGMAVLDYAVESGSGTNWALSRVPVASVPEPTEWALLMAGLGLVMPLARRSRRIRNNLRSLSN